MQLNMMISNWGQNISVNNMAIKSCNTQCWVGQHGYWESIQEDPPDLIIFEMAVNDQTYGSEQNVESLYRVYEALLYKLKNAARSPALLAVEAFRTAGYNKKDARSHCPPNGNGSSKQGALGKYRWCSHWWEVASVHQQLLKTFGIPFFSYRDLVWPRYDLPPPDLPKFWNGLSHADRIAHFLIADGVAAMLSEINAASCKHQYVSPNYSYPAPAISSDLECNLGTSYSAFAGLDHFPRTDSDKSNVGSVWDFREDVKGKPGWIGIFQNADTNQASSSISFHVRTHGKLQVQYLKSYHNMGKVEIRFDGGPIQHVLDGFSDTCYSVHQLDIIAAPEGNHTVTLSLVKDVQAIENASVHNSPNDIVRGSKFKLLALYGC
jgi:hypothetical protein